MLPHKKTIHISIFVCKPSCFPVVSGHRWFTDCYMSSQKTISQYWLQFSRKDVTTGNFYTDNIMNDFTAWIGFKLIYIFYNFLNQGIQLLNSNWTILYPLIKAHLVSLYILFAVKTWQLKSLTATATCEKDYTKILIFTDTGHMMQGVSSPAESCKTASVPCYVKQINNGIFFLCLSSTVTNCVDKIYTTMSMVL